MSINQVVIAKNKIILLAVAAFAVLGLAVSTQTVAAATGGTQSTGGSYSTAAVGNNTVSGTVRNGAGNPLGGVLVKLSADLSTTTNSSGYYELTNVPSGSYVLRFIKSGFVTQRYNVTFSSNSFLYLDVTLRRV